MEEGGRRLQDSEEVDTEAQTEEVNDDNAEGETPVLSEDMIPFHKDGMAFPARGFMADIPG